MASDTKTEQPAGERDDTAAREEKERQLDEALANTFPASDPVSLPS